VIRRVFSTGILILVVLVTVAAPSVAAPRLEKGHDKGQRGVLPLNPWAGPAGTSTMHGDPGSSDTTPYAGPGAKPGATTSVVLGSVCPTILAGADGVPQALCTEYYDRAPTLNLLDPDTFLPVARLHLQAGALLGGVYAYVDNHNRLVTVDGSGAVLLIGHQETATGWEIKVEKRYPYGPALTKSCGSATCDAIVSVAPGYDGHIWFATADARAGFVNQRTGKVVVRKLSTKNESIANSISTAPNGTVITTDRATYVLHAKKSRIRLDWKRRYDRGPARKPGQLSHGSGATPTYFGPRTGYEYVAITDNAAMQEHLLVYRTDTGKRICKQAVFASGRSGTENSPIGIGRSVYIASTYGYPYPAGYDGPSQPASADFSGGMQRVDLTARGCRTAWHSGFRSSAVPRFARTENVIYTVSLGAGSTYSLVRIDPRTGKVLSSSQIGVGPQADTLQMVGTILPDGTLLQGNITGLTVTRPGD
jgi:hypothetical protein